MCRAEKEKGIKDAIPFFDENNKSGKYEILPKWEED